MSVPAKIMKRLRDPTTVDLQPLEADPRYQAKREELAALEKRYGESAKRSQAALAYSQNANPYDDGIPKRPATATEVIVERAKRLVSGGKIISPLPAERANAEEEKSILNIAIVQKRMELAQIAADISAEVCQRFATQNAEAYRAALEATTALHQALEVGRTIRGRIIGAGYTINDPALPTHLFPAAAVLGDPDRVGQTPANQFKQWLRQKGII